MRVCRLTTIKDDPFRKEKVSFHFKNKKEATKFIDALDDHWAKVEFDEDWIDIDLDNVEQIIKDELMTDGTDLAEMHLRWAYSFAKLNGDDYISKEEKEFANRLSKIFNK